MALQRFTLLFIFLYFFFAISFHVKGTFSATSIARARRVHSHRQTTQNNLNIHTQSGSLSSFSSAASDSSLTGGKITNSEPIASTSSAKKNERTGFKEADLRPLVDNKKQVTFLDSVNLDEASAATHSADGDINPSRDGVFARVRSALIAFGASAAVGGAIGVGGVVIDRQFIHNNISEVSVNTTSPQSIDIDVNNPI